ncbi:MAG: acyltransferase family protein [Hyphomonas sp.]
MTDAYVSRRRYDLDWLRVIAFGLLILYHTGMFYVPWDWHVKSVHAGPGAEWAMRLLNPWRLDLLFLISGVALRFAADKLGGGKLARERLVRLGLPIIFGMAVIVAPQSWLQLLENGEFHGSFLQFWPQYLDIHSDFSITTPTWNHLWYVVYLLVYTLMLAPVARPLARFMEGAGAKVTYRLFAGKWGPVMALAVPAAPHLLIRFTLDPYFPTTHDLTADWANHAHSVTMLMTGFLLAKDRNFWSAVQRVMPWAVGLAVTLGAVLTPIWLNWDAITQDDSWGWLVLSSRIGRVLYAWFAILAALGLAQRFLNRPSPALTYMTEAIFPWYILHQTIIVCAGYWLTRQGLPVWIEAPAVIAATFGGCAVLHEYIIRRTPFLRPLFGLKPLSQSAVRRAPA